MSRIFFGCCLFLLPAVSWAEDAADGMRFFEERVHPILAKRCYACHGVEKQENGLRLDSREALLKGGDSETPGAVAGDATKSLILQAARHEGDLKMPPEEKIPEAELTVLTEWVTRGLPWSANVTGAKPILTAEALAEKARREHWSLQPVRRPTTPSVKNPGAAATPLDLFILARLSGGLAFCVALSGMMMRYSPRRRLTDLALALSILVGMVLDQVV